MRRADLIRHLHYFHPAITRGAGRQQLLYDHVRGHYTSNVLPHTMGVGYEQEIKNEHKHWFDLAPPNNDMPGRVSRWFGQSGVNDREYSFDYCYNYFQGFKAGNNVPAIASLGNLEMSCLTLWSYLASWGMLRGSTPLSRRSIRSLVPVIQILANEPLTGTWGIDVDVYNAANITAILNMDQALRNVLQSASWTLTTKIMLGVFGCVPAFDSEFKANFGFPNLDRYSLQAIHEFYTSNNNAIDATRLAIKDFMTGLPTDLLCSRAKVIDMVFFVG